MHTAAEQAQQFLTAAAVLGRAMELVEELARNGADAIRQEAAAADAIVMQGDEILVALRRLAMHLDRGAYLSQQTVYPAVPSPGVRPA